MERESFQSPEIANLLNSSFIPIKVDREERPDIDAIYMNYVQATTGSGGWPLNVFLTPDREPVFGGTYFPGPNSTTTASADTVGFAEILEKMRDVWSTQEQKCRDSAKEITKQLREFAEEGVHSHSETKPGEARANSLDLELLEEAYRTILRQYDKQNAGFSTAPKFPVPVKLRFLLQLGQWPSAVKDIVGEDDCTNAVTMAVTTLRKMARGGIRDHIGFGFARYSVTADWSLPHFEKMLSDQALLLDAYLDAFLLTHEPEMLSAVYDLAAYLINAPINHTNGGFFSSEDADSAPSRSDSEKREGAFSVWSINTLTNVLGATAADPTARFYNVHADGNVPHEHDPHDDFLNQNVLAIVKTPSQISRELGIPDSEITSILRDSRRKLREYRDRERPRPALDDKIVVAWNGLAIGALARAAAALSTVDELASSKWLSAATSAASFIYKELWDSDSKVLWRIWREGRGATRGLADDYTGFAHGLLELYAATFDTKWLQWADELTAALIRDFEAKEGGFYTTPHPAEDGSHGRDLLLRLKTGMDASEPSANSLAAMNLFRLASLLNDETYEAKARDTIMAFEAEIEQWPGSFPGLLGSVAWARVGGKSIWAVGEEGGAGAENEKSGEQDSVLEPAQNEGGGPVPLTMPSNANEGAAQVAASSPQVKPLTIDAVLSHIRAGTGVGMTLLRVKKGEEWLKERNRLVGALDIKEGFKVIVCEKGACRDVQAINDL